MGIIFTLEKSLIASLLIIVGATATSVGIFAYFSDTHNFTCEGVLKHDKDMGACTKALNWAWWSQIAMIIAGVLLVLIGIISFTIMSVRIPGIS